MLNGESNENGIKVLCMSKIQLVVYNQFWVLIGWNSACQRTMIFQTPRPLPFFGSRPPRQNFNRADTIPPATQAI